MLLVSGDDVGEGIWIHAQNLVPVQEYQQVLSGKALTWVFDALWVISHWAQHYGEASVGIGIAKPLALTVVTKTT